jgi:trigger factor
VGDERPPIPEQIKREVRQRCGFGCVVCGLPFYDYDHMDEYSVVRSHEPANITLLCPQHHDEKTRRLLSLNTVKNANAAPFNRQAEFTAPHVLRNKADKAVIHVGSNVFACDFARTASFVVARLSGRDLLTVHKEDGFLLIDLVLFGKDDQEILRIDKGARQVAVGNWDVESVGRRLTIRSAPRQIEVDIEFLDDGVRLAKGRLFAGGRSLEVDGARVSVNGSGSIEGNVSLTSGPAVGIHLYGPLEPRARAFFALGVAPQLLPPA